LFTKSSIYQLPFDFDVATYSLSNFPLFLYFTSYTFLPATSPILTDSLSVHVLTMLVMYLNCIYRPHPETFHLQEQPVIFVSPVLKREVS